MKRIKLSVVGSGISIVHVILGGIIISNSFRYFAVRRTHWGLTHSRMSAKKISRSKIQRMLQILHKKIQATGGKRIHGNNVSSAKFCRIALRSHGISCPSRC